MKNENQIPEEYLIKDSIYMLMKDIINYIKNFKKIQ